MADAKMNAAWWKANKAKTLLDSGDTVFKALTAFDTAKKGSDADKIEEALDKVGTAAAALKSKANKTLHKETIGYLETYMANCVEAIANLKKSTGKVLLDSIFSKGKIPNSVMVQLESYNKQLWNSLSDSLLFLSEMKSGKGTPKIFNTYIAPGSKSEVNLPGPILKAVTAEAQAGEYEGDGWSRAVKCIKEMLKAQKPTALPDCIKVEKSMQLEAIRKM